MAQPGEACEYMEKTFFKPELKIIRDKPVRVSIFLISALEPKLLVYWTPPSGVSSKKLTGTFFFVGKLSSLPLIFRGGKT